MTTLRELADGLPNGFHDAQVSACAINYVNGSVTFELLVWMGDERERERYRAARLKVTGLLFCAFEPPDPRYPFAAGAPLVVDLCEADPAVPAIAALPASAFSGRLWVASWNAFIHLAGTHAELSWTDVSPQARFFLNVDLDIESSGDLLPLVQALEPHAYSLERPPGRASFELAEPVSPTTPEPLILEFVRAVRALPPAARAVWSHARKRVLDIGIQSGRRPYQETHRLQPETLRAVADVGAEIAVTVYSLAPEDDVP